jgi:4-hydroxythreonine-4-phosphate dehydrogenase
MRPLLAISIGDPAGIGPEVTLAAAARTECADLVAYGDLELLRARIPRGVELRVVPVGQPEEVRRLPAKTLGVMSASPPLAAEDRLPGRTTQAGGAAQLAWIDAACDVVAAGRADALVTGPVSKAAIAASGAPGSASFLGHTEHLGARLGGAETVMTFHSDGSGDGGARRALTISLATTHLPLGAVARTLRITDVARASYWTARFVDQLGVDPALPVAVLALNPHAGEDGLLGEEERTIIAPGIAAARDRLIEEGRARALVGPIGAEGAIRRAVHERAYAACVAMYHDQATIPSKLVAFGDAVNVTLGLPIVRTSVDHGTAYDLAGTGRADSRGMLAAIELAARLAPVGRDRSMAGVA